MAQGVEHAGTSAGASPGEPREFVFRNIKWMREERAEFEIWHSVGGRDLEVSVTSSHRRARRRALASFVAVIALACAIVLGVEAGSPLTVQGALVFQLPLLIVLVSNLRHLLRGREGIKRWILGGIVVKPARVESVAITPDGVTTTIGTQTTFDPWSHYATVETTALLVTSRCYDGRAGGLPKRCIGDSVEFERIHGIILRWFRDGGGGRIEPTIERLRTLDAPCRSCGYNLRGVQVLVCPECGRELDLVLL